MGARARTASLSRVKDRYDMLNQAAHPLAGATMTGADMLVQVLADEGVDTIFGYSGGAILPIYDAVFRYNQEHRVRDAADRAGQRAGRGLHGRRVSRAPAAGSAWRW